MITTRAETTIERSADEVWSYATDTDRHGEWMQVTTVERLHGRGDQVGDRGRERTRIGPITRDLEFEVVAADRGRLVTWRVTGGAPVAGDLSLELEPLGPTSTRVTYGGRFEGRGLMRLLQPIIAAEVRQGTARELGRLKEAVEARQGGDGA